MVCETRSRYKLRCSKAKLVPKLEITGDNFSHLQKNSQASELRVFREFSHPTPPNAPHVNLVDDDDWEPMHSGSHKRRSSGSSGRATKSSRMDVAVDANAEKSIAKAEYYKKKASNLDRFVPDDQSSIENVMLILNGLDGLDEDMIDVALENIIHDPNWRRSFVLMNPEWRVGWLRRLAKK